MSQTYSYLREQVVQGVMRSAASQPRTTMIPPPLDRIRAQFDACIFSINSQVAQVYAQQESHREMLRASTALTFTSGSATLPTNALKSYIEDYTFYPTSTPTAKYSFRRYPDWLRGGDPRLGLWTTIGETIKAKTPQPVTTFSGSGTLSYIASPDIPDTEDDEFVAPEDYYPDLIAACVQYIIGQTMEVAAQTA